MTAGVRTPGKGTKLQVTISSVLTDIDLIESLKVSNGEVQTYEAPSLDSGVGIPVKPTGFVKGDKVTGKGWCDPGSTVHLFLLGLIAAPAVVAWKVLYLDAGTTAFAFNGTLTKFDVTVEPDKGLQFDFEIAVDGIGANS